MPAINKTLEKILSRIEPPAQSAQKLSKAEEDLSMIAEELVAALGDGSSRGVANALRAAFGCMSEDRVKKYAEGGMVDDKEDEDKNEEPTRVVYQSPDRQDSASPVSWKEGSSQDQSMIYVADRKEYQERDNKLYTKEDLDENERVWKRNADASINIANQTGSYIGETIDEDLMDLVLGDPEKYVEVRSNPDAYDRFKKAYQKAFDDRDPEEGMEVAHIWEMLYDPKFWSSLKTKSFNSKQDFESQLAMLNSNNIGNQELTEDQLAGLTPEQRAAYNAKRAVAKSQKPELVELRDPSQNLTVLTDNPAKALRRRPALKVVSKKPATKFVPTRTIQMPPLR